jgi:hypothetical protein
VFSVFWDHLVAVQRRLGETVCVAKKRMSYIDFEMYGNAKLEGEIPEQWVVKYKRGNRK